MEGLLSKQIKLSLTRLGLYQIVGGILEILITFWAILKETSFTELTILIYIVIILIYVYSVFCGILCIKAKKNALIISLINQIFQVFGFAITGYAFTYIAGIYIKIGLDWKDSLEFNFGMGISKFDFNINLQKERLELDFNFVALAFVYWIDKLMQKIKKEEILKQSSSIGET